MESNISESLYVSQAQLQKGQAILTLLLSNKNHCQTIRNHHSELHQLRNNTQRSLDSESLLPRIEQPNLSESTTAVQNPKHQKEEEAFTPEMLAIRNTQGMSRKRRRAHSDAQAIAFRTSTS
jgi:hypothetical protein